MLFKNLFLLFCLIFNLLSIQNLFAVDTKDKLKFENLHNFLWLSRLDRKNSKTLVKNIINSWINIFSNYHPNTWDAEITAKRTVEQSAHRYLLSRR